MSKQVEDRVIKATRFHPNEVWLVFGLLSYGSLPTVDEQEQFAMRLMEQKGYRFIRRERFLLIGSRSLFRFRDHLDVHNGTVSPR
jgi:hypothetical protein